MFIGTGFMSIAGGLYTTFNPSTPSAHWIGYQLFQGIGAGLGFQTVFIGMPAFMKDIPHLTGVATGTLMFFQYLGSSVIISIALTVFQNVLRSKLASEAGLNEQQIEALLLAGTAKAREIAQHIVPEKSIAVQQAYNDAITSVFVSFPSSTLNKLHSTSNTVLVDPCCCLDCRIPSRSWSQMDQLENFIIN
jgi:hypothetical protein